MARVDPDGFVWLDCEDFPMAPECCRPCHELEGGESYIQLYGGSGFDTTRREVHVCCTKGVWLNAHPEAVAQVTDKARDQHEAG